MHRAGFFIARKGRRTAVRDCEKRFEASEGGSGLRKRFETAEGGLRLRERFEAAEGGSGLRKVAYCKAM